MAALCLALQLTQSDPVVQGFQKTGLGERVATLFVKAVGQSTLGLAYGLGVAELFLAPAMPSTTARAGGIFMPIINSLSLASGSEPGEFANLHTMQSKASRRVRF